MENDWSKLIAGYNPTPEQMTVFHIIRGTGYEWDTSLTIKFTAVALRKNNKVWLFGLDGGMQFIPDITKHK